MLLFMPWCPIDKAYKVGSVTILPFARQKPIVGLNKEEQAQVNTIMGTYKNMMGEPVRKASLVHYSRKSPLEDLSETEIDEAYDLVALACFCGLANRQYFNPLGPYCNSDCFTLYVQSFEDTDSILLKSRRRDGLNRSDWAVEKIAITIPVYVHTIRSVSLDEKLMSALLAHRSAVGSEWGRWQSAISCFNWANTDSDNIRHQVEWVNLCGAFEHLLGAKPKADDVARRFSETLVPFHSLLARDSNRRGTNLQDRDHSLRYEWMRDFYKIRGDFAHGKLASRRPMVWTPLEHLLWATIAFPLVVKALLNKAGKYDFTCTDQAEIDGFEQFADTKDFVEPPPDQKKSFDSHWKRIADDRREKVLTRVLVERHMARREMPPGGAKQVCDPGEVPTEEK